MMQLVGFLKIMPVSPAPVVALFSDIDNGDATFYQKISETGRIISFVPSGPIPADRLLIGKQDSYPNVELGDEAILAVETDDLEIRIRRYSKYLGFLREFIEKQANAAPPFLIFEVAKALNDEEMLRRAATRCTEILNARSASLATRWLEGASLSPALLAELLPQPPQDSVPTGYKRLNFSGSTFLVEALLKFSYEITGKNRSEFLKEMIDQVNFSDIVNSSTDVIDSISSTTLKLILNGDSAERAYLTWLTSRGEIRVDAAFWVTLQKHGYNLAKASLSTKSFRELVQLKGAAATSGNYTLFLMMAGVARFDARFLTALSRWTLIDVIGEARIVELRKLIKLTKA